MSGDEISPTHSTHSTYLFLSLLTLSTAFLQKASGPGKNLVSGSVSNKNLVSGFVSGRAFLTLPYVELWYAWLY